MRAMFQFLGWAIREMIKAYQRWKAEEQEHQALPSPILNDTEHWEQITPDEHVNGKTWRCPKCGKRNAEIYRVVCLWCGNPRVIKEEADG